MRVWTSSAVVEAPHLVIAKLDDKINDAFGEIFEIYDEIKFKGEELGITLIASDNFDEDSVMRYHFVSYNDEDYDATAVFVLNY